MVINHGTFRVYKPDLPEGHPYRRYKVVFFRNELGADWYQTIAHKPASGRTYVAVQNGRAVSHAKDPSMLTPENCQIIETDQVVEIGYTFDGATFAKPAVTRAKVNAEAGRRITLKFPIHEQINVVRGAKQRPGMWEWIDSVRAKAAELEAMQPIPEDFRDDKYWPS